MEITTVIEALPSISLAITTLIGVGSAIYKHLKARKYKAAFELSDDALAAVVLGLESLPDGMLDKKRIKGQIRDLATEMNIEVEKLKPFVGTLQALFEEMGGRTTHSDINARKRALAAAIEHQGRRQGQRSKRPTGLTYGVLIGLVVVCLSAGCLGPRPEAARLTRESVVVHSDGRATVVVEFPPRRISPDPDDFSFTVQDSRVLISTDLILATDDWLTGYGPVYDYSDPAHAYTLAER